MLSFQAKRGIWLWSQRNSVIARSPGVGAEALRATKCPSLQRASELGGEGRKAGAKQCIIRNSQLRIKAPPVLFWCEIPARLAPENLRRGLIFRRSWVIFSRAHGRVHSQNPTRRDWEGTPIPLGGTVVMHRLLVSFVLIAIALTFADQGAASRTNITGATASALSEWYRLILTGAAWSSRTRSEHTSSWTSSTSRWRDSPDDHTLALWRVDRATLSC
jgi:hypothetical protein